MKNRLILNVLTIFCMISCQDVQAVFSETTPAVVNEERQPRIFTINHLTDYYRGDKLDELYSHVKSTIETSAHSDYESGEDMRTIQSKIKTLKETTLSYGHGMSFYSELSETAEKKFKDSVTENLQKMIAVQNEIKDALKNHEDRNPRGSKLYHACEYLSNKYNLKNLTKVIEYLVTFMDSSPHVYGDIPFLGHNPMLNAMEGITILSLNDRFTVDIVA